MHKPTLMKKSFVTTAIALLAMCSGAWRAEADGYVQTNLVSDIAGLALVTDTDLQNPWGVARSATSPFWSSNQGTNTSTLYMVADSTQVTKNPLTVTIPTTGTTGPQGPTGMVNNTNTSSVLDKWG